MKYLVIRQDRLIIITDKYHDAKRASKRRFPARWRVDTKIRHLSRYGTVSVYLLKAKRVKNPPSPGIYTLRTIKELDTSDRVKKRLREILLQTKVERWTSPPPEKKPPVAKIFRIDFYRLGHNSIRIFDKQYKIKVDRELVYDNAVIYESRNRYIAIVFSRDDNVYISVPKGDFAEIERYEVTKKTILDVVTKLEKYELPTPLEKFLERLKEEVALDAWESL